MQHFLAFQAADTSEKVIFTPEYISFWVWWLDWPLTPLLLGNYDQHTQISSPGNAHADGYITLWICFLPEALYMMTKEHYSRFLAQFLVKVGKKKVWPISNVQYDMPPPWNKFGQYILNQASLQSCFDAKLIKNIIKCSIFSHSRPQIWKRKWSLA